MSIGSDIREKARQVSQAHGERGTFWSSDLIPYVLSTSDALVIILSSIGGGLVYHLVAGSPVPNLLPCCAVGLMAAFIHILRMSGVGYYDLPDSAKPGVEITEILVCWFSTGILLAFFAFLLKIGGCLLYTSPSPRD